MTRKDFWSVSQVIVRATDVDDRGEGTAAIIRERLVDEFIALFSHSNPRFQADLFRKACGL